MAVETRDERSVPRSGRDATVIEAQERWKRCADHTNECNKNWLADYKFAHADSYNRWQWPDTIAKERDLDSRPCLTINKTRQHNLQIKNDAKQNKPGIKFRAVGGGASYESAQMHDAIARHVEYQSQAQDSYDLATGYMVDGGFGWLRLVTRYLDDESFDQEIYIEGVQDALSVYLDPDAKEVGKLDAGFGFAFQRVQKSDFERKHPNHKQFATESPLDGVTTWLTDDEIMEVEYYRRVEVEDTIFAVPSPEDPSVIGIIKQSSIEKTDPAMLEALRADVKAGKIKSRTTTRFEVEYYLIAGNHVIGEKGLWPGKYIPFALVCAEETLIEGKMDRKSHTRALIDPQRMYNYWSSAAVEYGALQGKTPWITAIEAIEGYEKYWQTANTVNYSYLPYNGLDDAGQKIAPPTRTEPPVAAPVCLEGMRIAQMEMMLVSGQYESSMGQGSNERTGKAIDARARHGDNATYHFVNGLAVAIRNLGKQIEDLIPKVYDTKRILQINAQDGTPMELVIDPKAAQAVQVRQASDAAAAQRILNPNVGRYEVEADIGPAYGTKRMETWNALTLLLTQAPQLTNIIGDLLLRSADFHLADEAAARLRRMVPAYALGEGPNQNEQLLGTQVQHLTELLAKAMEELSLEKLKVKGKEQQRDIGVFDAFTKRLNVLLRAQIEAAKPKGSGEHIEPGEGKVDVWTIQELIRQAALESEDVDLQPILDANADLHEAGEHVGQLLLPGMVGSKPPVPGAKLGMNGRWYLPDAATNKRLTPVA